MERQAITTMFLDIGGVLLTNGWGREQRNNAIKYFKLDKEEVDERHHLTFDTYEEGKLTLNDYLKQVIFYEPRQFTNEEFIEFMMGQSRALPGAMDYFKSLKKKHGLKVIALSNEGRELNAYRVKKFKLTQLFDAFISSSYVHMRKPDADIYKMAMDIAHAQPENSIYTDDRYMFVQVAESLGMNGLHYQGLQKSRAQFKKIEFSNKRQ